MGPPTENRRQFAENQWHFGGFCEQSTGQVRLPYELKVLFNVRYSHWQIAAETPRGQMCTAVRVLLLINLQITSCSRCLTSETLGRQSWSEQTASLGVSFFLTVMSCLLHTQHGALLLSPWPAQCNLEAKEGKLQPSGERHWHPIARNNASAWIMCWGDGLHTIHPAFLLPETKKPSPPAFEFVYSGVAAHCNKRGQLHHLSTGTRVSVHM